ncbi:MAG: transcription termination factor NusA [Myxococcales bacterium]|nr:transcription termination factor NusA [Myxococcales bacterium]MDD9968954.1 transcription termination factor NusA [Myxococcales bacterium]
MQEGTLSLHNIIEQVSREKGIDPKILVETMEQAILTAAKRSFGPNRELEARFNDDIGQVDLFQYMTVVEEVDDGEREISSKDAARYGLEADIGEELGFQIFYLREDADKAKQQDREFGDLLGLQQARQGFGRIAAQTAKQVIIQRVRDAERDNIYNEYKDRKGEIITGIVRRFERGSNIIVDLGRTEGVLPQKHQTPRETYRPGDRIVAFLVDIDREARGPQIILSRTDVGLLVKLFEMEVPEIYEGIVRIVAAAREPGARSKIAVSSRDSDVDPVGACVGMKGSRVQAVVQELRGEKIDIVPYDRDPARFVCNAIAPADVSRVIIDEANSSMELVVPDDKLSLAIGRRGQNVRLASQLAGWRLDVIGESKFKVMEEEAIAALSSIENIDRVQALALYKQGFRGLDEVAEAPVAELAAIDGVGGEQAAKSLRERAELAMERRRRERIEAGVRGDKVLTDRDLMALIEGVTPRIADLLYSAGYRTIDAIADEADVDKLAIRTGIGAKKAQAVQAAIARYKDEDAARVEEGQEAARAREAAARAAEAAEAQRLADEEAAARRAEEGADGGEPGDVSAGAPESRVGAGGDSAVESNAAGPGTEG